MNIKRYRLWLLLTLALLPLLSARAEPWQPVQLAHAEMRDVQSQHTGRTYRIFLSVPRGEAPAQGYPVLYVLDANLLFPVLSQQALMYQPHAQRDGREPVLVVGIGYPGDEPFDIQARAEDYTPPAADMSDTGDQLADKHGGAEHFLDFIEQELKPLVESRHRVDPVRQTLFGHSYGGLLTVHALLTRPQSFQNYLASSPSLWWNHRHVFGELAGFTERRKVMRSSPRLLLNVGDREQPSADLPQLNERQRHQAQRRMLDNARELDAELAKLGVISELRVQPGGDHGSNAFFSAMQVLDFALSR